MSTFRSKKIFDDEFQRAGYEWSSLRTERYYADISMVVTIFSSAQVINMHITFDRDSSAGTHVPCGTKRKCSTGVSLYSKVYQLQDI